MIIQEEDLKQIKAVDTLPTQYDYSQRGLIMTPAEIRFFKLLDHALADKYYVFPQIHLPALFEHKIRGQAWFAAYAHINRKSVDFVICSRYELKPLLAIELDDWSHSLPHRKKRDAEVERIFAASGLPLLRFEGKQDFSVEYEYILDELRSAGIKHI